MPKDHEAINTLEVRGLLRHSYLDININLGWLSSLVQWTVFFAICLAFLFRKDTTASNFTLYAVGLILEVKII